MTAGADGFLGGRLVVLQPRRGHHRAGLDALLLGASVPAAASGRAVDLGAGTGVAGLVAAVSAPALAVDLAERETDLVALAAETLARPENAALAGRVAVRAVDLLGSEAARAAAGLPRESFDLVLTNPPWWEAGEGRVSPKAGRAKAHVVEGGLAAALDAWIRVAAGLARPKAELRLVFRADRPAELLAALDGRFGAVRLLPVHARAGEAAIRLVVAATKGSRARAAILPGLVLHDADGRPSARLAAIAAGDAGLAL